MPVFEPIKEISLSDLELHTLPKLVDSLETNQETREVDLASLGGRFRRVSDFPESFKIQQLLDKLEDLKEMNSEGEYIFLEDEQAVLSAALVLGLSIEQAGGDTGLDAEQIRNLIKRIHTRK